MSIAKTHVSNTNLFNGDVLQKNAKRYPKITCFTAMHHCLRDQTRPYHAKSDCTVGTFGDCNVFFHS